MDPLNLSGTEMDREEEEDDYESEEIVISPMKAQEATYCDIVNMVKTLNGAIDTTGLPTAMCRKHGKR